MRAERVHCLPEIFAVLLCHVCIARARSNGAQFSLAVGAEGFDRIQFCRAHRRVDAEKKAHARGNRERKSRSEEHTSELQSHLNLVCPLLLEKKKHWHRESV